MKYQTMYGEDYYRDSWDRLAKKYRENDPEHDLQIVMGAYKDADIPEAARVVVEQIEARRVYDFLHETLKGTMRTVQALVDGKASLGYTSTSLETRERHDIREQFEFDCLRLADFKRKYNI